MKTTHSRFHVSSHHLFAPDHVSRAAVRPDRAAPISIGAFGASAGSEGDAVATFWSSDVLDRLQEPLTRYHE